MSRIPAKLKPLSVFIDANVYLTFYAYSDHDLETLSKIIQLNKEGKIRLYCTSQLLDEVSRNRETKIFECISHFKKEKLSIKLPIVMNDFAEAKDFYKSCSDSERIRDKLISEVKQKADDNSLHADVVLDDIFDCAEIIEVDSDIRNRAVRRYRAGNPPGKGNFVGDQLNWECLLNSVDSNDLHIVSGDGDYRSDLDRSKAKEFLRNEWEDEKGGNLFLHKNISEFLSSVDKRFILATIEEKNSKIHVLISSPSFQSTHNAIANLTPFIPLLDDEDVKTLVYAAIENNQISLICTDSDVESFFQKILKGRITLFPEEIRHTIYELFFSNIFGKDLDDDLPF